MVYHAYILAGASAVLYIGVTRNLERRVAEHKRKVIAGFTRTYNVTRLVYFEPFDTPSAAVEREKQLKRWARGKKVALIEKNNPRWRDLSDDFGSRG